MARKLEKVCVECGRPIPKERRMWTCSDYCAQEHRRKKDAQNREKTQSLAQHSGRGNRKDAEDIPGGRPCAGGCGRWITDYRCPECWAKLRAANGCTVHPEESGLEEHDSWLGL